MQVFDAQDVEEQPMTDLWKPLAQSLSKTSNRSSPWMSPDSSVLRSGSEFIDSSLQTGGGVAIHCAQGISRSSSTCIAYLMMKDTLVT